VPALVRSLADSDPHVRHQSAVALAEIGRPAASAVPALVAALKDSDDVVPPAAFDALVSLGPEADAAAPALVALLSEPSSYVRERAVDALASIGSGAVPALNKALGSSNAVVVEWAARALERVGRKARSAEPALLAAFGRTSASTRRAVAGALAAVVNKAENPALIPALAVALSATDLERKEQIVALLDAFGAGPHAGELRRHADLVVAALVREVRAQDAAEKLRRQVIGTLARLGTAAQTAIPALIDELERDKLTIDAAQALRAIVAPDAPAAELTRALKDKAGLDDRQTALALSAAGVEAVPLLLEALAHRNARARAAAAWALAALAPKTDAVLAALEQRYHDANRAVRLAALDAVVPQVTEVNVTSAGLFPGLIAATQSWDAATRVRAGLRLAEIERRWLQVAGGDEAVGERGTVILLDALQRGALPPATVEKYVAEMNRLKSVLDLLPAADHPDPEVRAQVAAVLAQVGLWEEKQVVTEKDRQRVQQILQAALTDRVPAVRETAARSLGQLGPLVKDAVPALQEVLRDREPAVREAAAIALWQVNHQIDDVIPLLIASLASGSYDAPGLIAEVRQERGASAALATLVAMDTAAETALLEALHNPNATIRAGAAVALGGRQTCCPALVGLALAVALQDSNATVRMQAAVALRWQGAGHEDASKAIVVRLEEAIKTDPERAVCLEALTTLGVLGPDVKLEPAAYLLELLEDRQPELRAEAVRTVGLLAREADRAVPALRLCLKDRSATVRERAAEALGRMGTPALPALRDALTDKDAEVRKHGVLALGRMGAPAKVALPDLEKLRKDPDEEVQSAAAEAITKLAEAGA
jgi:HEAT repeat protein